VLSLVRRREEPPEAQPAPLPSDRYTVLILDENQLDRLLHRQGVRSVNPPHSGTVIAHDPVEPRRVSWLALAAVAGVLVTGTVAWLLWPSRAAETAATPASAPLVPDTAPVVATGASFSVDLASFLTDAPAQAAAEQLQAAGWPAFTWRLDGGRRHALVGPYVSIEEAETAQAQLSRLGNAGARLHVDDRLRVTPAALSTTRRTPQYPAVVLVAAPGRLSFVFELADEPRSVSGQRVGATAFMVNAGPLATPVEAQTWKAPGDVSLVSRLVLSQRGQDATMLQAVVTLPQTADASVRLHGRRVYVDVARRVDEVTPVDAVPAEAPRQRRAAPAADAPYTPAAAPAPRAGSDAAVESYRVATQSLVARFEEVQPFLRQTVGSASPDVLAALSGTCADLEQSLMLVVVPPAARATHGLLLSAVQLARNATTPSFTGDRAAQVRESAAQFAAAKARLGPAR
jgi:cell division septation protein DedD